MKKSILAGYVIVLFFIVLSIIRGNYEFVAYAAATVVLLGLIHYFDKRFDFNHYALWGFDIWMLLHIFGGLFFVGNDVLYNHMLIPIVGEPYLILKYDQFVHIYCYFIFALLVWSVVSKIADKKAAFGLLAFITVMTASGIGGLNEIIEFTTTIFFDNNVGGYENTAIDIVANLVGALIAIPLFKKIK